jgi:hypothetical protein
VLDIGFIGYVSVGGTLPLAIQCRNGSQRVAAPAAAPTYAIYPSGFGSTVDTGSLGAADTGSFVGFRTGTQAISASYSAGELYTVIFEYTESGNARSAIGTFQVV